MKNRVLKMGVCLFLILMVLSGCAGSAGQIQDDPKTEPEAESGSPNEEKTPRKGSGSSGAVTGDTPEEIIEIFFDAFEEQDAETMLSCFYLDEMAERFSFPDYVDRMGAFSASAHMGPADSRFYRELTLSERKGEFAKRIRLFAWSILLAEDEQWSDETDYAKARPGVDYDWAEELTDKVDPEQLRRIRILSIDENNPEMQQRDGYQKTVSSNRRIYGVDDWCERAVLFKCNGNLFYKGFTLVQYDDQWQIFGLNAAILGDSPLGTATLIEDEDDYWDAIE